MYLLYPSSQDAIIELLYNHGADLEAKTDDEETPAGKMKIIIGHSKR